jgi:ABC-2 type transport system ATP-binding protein
MPAVTLQHIAKTYGKEKTLALQDVSFTVGKGELFGLIGPDGAGKTSLFRILTTLLLPDGGSATVAGFDVVRDYQQIRRTVGYMPGKFSLYPDLTVEENLNFFATVFGTTIAENYHLIKDIYIQIEPFRNRRAGKLSGGMKQKLALCCALIHKPTVLFLDEPTTGVDAVSRKEFWQMLQRLKQQQITILVSTPYMDEATLCDRIALIQTGRLLSIDTPVGIIHRFGEQLYGLSGQHMQVLLQDLRAYPAVSSCYTFGETHHLTFAPTSAGPEKHLADLRQYLAAKGHTDALRLEPLQPTIEDCFMKLMTQQSASSSKLIS